MSQKVFSPSPGVEIKNAEAFIQYYRSFLDYCLWKKVHHDHDFKDISQEIIIVLLLLWEKFQCGTVEYLTSTYVRITIKNALNNYFVRQAKDINVLDLPFKVHKVSSTEQINLDDEKFEESFEQKIFFEEAEAKVTQQLNLLELQMYDLLKQGYGRREIFKQLGLTNERIYTKLLEKLRILYRKYA